MLNKVTLIGRLGRDPELKYSATGMPIARFSIATDESYTDKDGNRVNKAEWHNIVVFQRTAENCSNFLGKGSLVYVEGSLQTRKWQDQQGQDRYTTEVKGQRVIFLDRKGAQDEGTYHGDGGYVRQNSNSGQANNSYGNQSEKQGMNFSNDDMGPAFPSEASGMDDVPF